MGQLKNQTHSYLLETSVCDLHNQQPLQCQSMLSLCGHHEHRRITDSQQPDSSQLLTDCQYAGNSDDEFDALIKDSANLERTLSDIIEGRHNPSTNVAHDAEDGVLVLPVSRDALLETSISNTGDCVPTSACRDNNNALQVAALACASGQFPGDKRIGRANIDDIWDGKILGIANVCDNTGDKLAGVANVGGSSSHDDKIVVIANVVESDDINSIDGKFVGVANVDESDDIKCIDGKIVGVANIGYADDKTDFGDASFDDLLDEKAAGVGTVGCTDNTTGGRNVGLGNDGIIDKKIVDVQNDDDITDEKICDVSSFDYINDKKIVGVANYNTTDENIVSVSNDNTTDKKIADVEKYASSEKIVDVVNIGDRRNEKVANCANAFSFDTTQRENIFQRVGEMEHDDVVYVFPGSSDAVMSLFGYKGEATLMLKESTV